MRELLGYTFVLFVIGYLTLYNSFTLTQLWDVRGLLMIHTLRTVNGTEKIISEHIKSLSVVYNRRLSSILN